MKRLNYRIDELKWNLIGIFGKLFIDLLFLTTRIETVGLSGVAHIIQSRKYLLAFWHSRLLLISYIFKGLNVLVMVSQSKDGEIIARILRRQGQDTVRGSSTRGGLRVLAGMIKNLKETGRPGATTPDGPQGPRFKVKPGTIAIAKKTGYPIVPVSYSASRIKVFSSWDRFVLPIPFSKCRAIYGEPIYVPKDVDADEEKRCLLKLETELCRITQMADHHFGHDIR